jgi:hypothetical protein
LIALPTNAHAQFQRLALALGEFIAQAGSSISIPSYCIDHDRDPPPENLRLPYAYGDPGSIVVSYNGHDYSPVEARTAGIGEFVAGDDYNNARFDSHVNGQVKVRVRSTAILSQVKEDIPAEQIRLIGAALSSRAKVSNHKTQEIIWNSLTTADKQVLLRDLNLYEGHIDGIAGHQLKAAETKFSSLSGIGSGFFEDGPEISDIAEYAVKSGNALSDAGRTIINEQIEPRAAGVGFRGQDWISEFRVYHHLPAGETVDAAFIEHLRADENVAESLPIFNELDTSVWLRQNDGIEAWKVDDEGNLNRVVGQPAVKMAEVDFASSIGRIGEEHGTYLFPYVYSNADSSIAFQVGKTTLKLDRNAVEAFLAGNGSLPELETAVGGSGMNGGGNEPPIFVLRGPADDIPDPNRPKSAPIDLSALGLSQINATKLAAELKRRIGNKRSVYLGGDPVLATSNAKQIDVVDGAKDLAVLKGEKIETWGALDDLTQVLDRYKVPIITDGHAGIDAGNLLILTGHRDENLDEYLGRLTTQGVLDDKIVVLFSCYGSQCERPQSRILRSDNGPKALIYFPTDINKVAAVAVIKELVLQVNAPDYRPEDINAILQKSVDRAVAKYPQISDDILKLKNTVVQVSTLPLGTFAAVA